MFIDLLEATSKEQTNVIPYTKAMEYERLDNKIFGCERNLDVKCGAARNEKLNGKIAVFGCVGDESGNLCGRLFIALVEGINHYHKSSKGAAIMNQGINDEPLELNGYGSVEDLRISFNHGMNWIL